VLPSSHRGFRQIFELLLDSLTKGLFAEVTTVGEDEAGQLIVVAVSLSGRAARGGGKMDDEVTVVS
jgi:hypothetical protein